MESCWASCLMVNTNEVRHILYNILTILNILRIVFVQY